MACTYAAAVQAVNCSKWATNTTVQCVDLNALQNVFRLRLWMGCHTVLAECGALILNDPSKLITLVHSLLDDGCRTIWRVWLRRFERPR